MIVNVRLDFGSRNKPFGDGLCLFGVSDLGESEVKIGIVADGDRLRAEAGEIGKRVDTGRADKLAEL